MGAINYGSSDYVSIGLDVREEIDPDEMEFLYDEITNILDRYDFYYYHVVIKSGYHEGFYIDIENNFPVAFDDWEEKQDVQKEITELKQFLIDCARLGMVQYSPGWCTGYSDYKGTIAAIKDAVKEMRTETKQTPTWAQYERKGV